MSWHFSQALEAAFSRASCSAGEQSVPLKRTGTGVTVLSPARTTARSSHSRSGDDITTFDGLEWRGRVDVVSGGFPCQAYSTVARGRNVADDLWPEMRRVVAETAPRYVFAENPSWKAIEAAADDLESMGYKARCIPLSTADLGGDDVRVRYWLRAHANGDGELHSPVDAEEVAKLQRMAAGVWSADPGIPRVFDGMADRVVRLSATGDGQVPIVAATAWRLLSI